MKNVILRGTLLLTIAGVISRIMGFFYRIFLANTIGAEGMGIYQLIFPIYSVCFSLCASGIETAISKLTAEKYAIGKVSEASGILKAGVLLTLSLSLICSFAVFQYASPLAITFLKEPRCIPLLKILALSIPLGALHTCICGYYFGIHKASVPAFSQLIEQSFRIGCVFLLYRIYLTNRIKLSPAIAVIGLVFGEFCSFLFTITCITCRPKSHFSFYFPGIVSNLKEILLLSTPLTISRICMNLLASLEATMMPNALKAYGLEPSNALSIYGILTGMALPFILFPNALTSSISLMLLPSISESKASGQTSLLKRTIKKTFFFCIFLGCICTVFFLLFGKFLGEFVFSSSLAGNFITILAWICPFLYLNTTLNSILNGLGKTNITFFTGIVSLFLRIGFIFFVVPKIGIHGYLFGLLASQLFITFFSSYFLSQAI